jgi:two-component system, sensor histidine kinase and response regulator
MITKIVSEKLSYSREMLIHDKKNMYPIFRLFTLLALLISLIYPLFLMLLGKLGSNIYDISVTLLPAIICYISYRTLKRNHEVKGWFLMFCLFPLSITFRFFIDYINGLQNITILLAIAALFLIRKKNQVLIGFAISMLCFNTMHIYINYRLNYNFKQELPILIFGLLTLSFTLYYLLLFLRNLLIDYHQERSKAIKEINDAKLILEEKNKIISSVAELHKTVTSILSHDVKAAILPVRYLIHNYRANIISKEDLYTYLDRLEDEVNRIDKVFEDALSLTTIPEKKDYNTNSTVIVTDVVTEVINEASIALAKKKLSVINEIPTSLMLHLNTNLIRIILRNLISNAIKFSYPEKVIKVSYTETVHNLVISIKDTGVGISTDNILRIHQGNAVQTDGTQHEKGTGLGLRFCKDIIERIGGELYIKSEPNLYTEIGFLITKNIGHTTLTKGLM